LGRTLDTFFEKQYKALQEKIPYLDRVKYSEAQPEKPKLGFHTAGLFRSPVLREACAKLAH
jgi:hypothetical protein